MAQIGDDTTAVVTMVVARVQIEATGEMRRRREYYLQPQGGGDVRQQR